MRKNKIYLIINILALSLLAVFLIYNYVSGGIFYEILSEDSVGITEYFSSLEGWVQIVAVLLVVIVEVIIGVIPGLLVYPIIALLIGPWMGFLLILIGNIVGSVLNFVQGRIIWRGFASDSERESRAIDKLGSQGAIGLFVLRLNPLTSFDFLPYFAGGSGMKFWPFLIANTLGLLPLIWIGTFIGESLLDEYSWLMWVMLGLTVVYLGGVWGGRLGGEGWRLKVEDWRL